MLIAHLAATLAAIFLAASVDVGAPGDDVLDVPLRRGVSFGDTSDQVTVDDINPAERQITVLLQPMGEACAFRFTLAPGENLQVRVGGPEQSLVCRLTLLPLQSASEVHFTVACDEIRRPAEIKCPPAP